MGRPREHDRDQMAEDLIEWAKLDDSINLNAFCAMKEIPPSNITIWANQCNEFRKAYELAKTYLGVRRELKLTKNELHVKAYDLNAATYDYFLKQEKRDQALYDSELRKSEESSKQVSHTILVNNDLAAGSNIPAKAISEERNQSPK